MSFEQIFNRIKVLTDKDLSKKDIATLTLSAVEELGEFAAALLIETGVKNKALSESSKSESVDLIICGLALHHARGGDYAHLLSKIQEKLDKWASNQ